VGDGRRRAAHRNHRCCCILVRAQQELEEGKHAAAAEGIPRPVRPQAGGAGRRARGGPVRPPPATSGRADRGWDRQGAGE
jgi:hypothetical protein